MTWPGHSLKSVMNLEIKLWIFLSHFESVHSWMHKDQTCQCWCFLWLIWKVTADKSHPCEGRLTHAWSWIPQGRYRGSSAAVTMNAYRWRTSVAQCLVAPASGWAGMYPWLPHFRDSDNFFNSENDRIQLVPLVFDNIDKLINLDWYVQIVFLNLEY